MTPSPHPYAICATSWIFALVLCGGLAGCSDTQEGGNGGNGQTSSGNACQQGTAGCSEAPLENGQAYAQVIFAEQRVDAMSGSPPLSSPDGVATILISAFEDTYDCSTSQPGDEFGDVRCAAYSMGSFIQGALGDFLCFEVTGALSGQSAPVTLRVLLTGDGTFLLETAWGFCVCDDGTASVDCDGSIVGNGARDACCTVNSDCGSNRCCTPDQPCFESLDDRWTCRDPS